MIITKSYYLGSKYLGNARLFFLQETIEMATLKMTSVTWIFNNYQKARNTKNASNHQNNKSIQTITTKK
jgi:hypothetical protein